MCSGLTAAHGGPVVFEGYVAVTGPGRQRNLERLHVEAPVSTNTTKAQVDAMSIALGQVADAVARRLA